MSDHPIDNVGHVGCSGTSFTGLPLSISALGCREVTNEYVERLKTDDPIELMKVITTPSGSQDEFRSTVAHCIYYSNKMTSTFTMDGLLIAVGATRHPSGGPLFDSSTYQEMFTHARDCLSRMSNFLTDHGIKELEIHNVRTGSVDHIRGVLDQVLDQIDHSFPEWRFLKLAKSIGPVIRDFQHLQPGYVSECPTVLRSSERENVGRYVGW